MASSDAKSNATSHGLPKSIVARDFLGNNGTVVFFMALIALTVIRVVGRSATVKL